MLILGKPKLPISHVWQRKILRRAASRYADQGWRVLPGAYRRGDRFLCSPLCPTSTCHPAVEPWEDIASAHAAQVDAWWRQFAYSILLPTGHSFDVIEVSHSLGATAASLVNAPVAMSPTGRWMFLVDPGDSLRPELASRLDVVWHAAGSWIPAPPTPTPSGRIQWVIDPARLDWRLPDPYEVQQVLISHLPMAKRRPRPVQATTW
jgi:hypothetical protein